MTLRDLVAVYHYILNEIVHMVCKFHILKNYLGDSEKKFIFALQ